MEPDLVELFLELSMAKDVWDSIAHMYYDASDESQIYSLRCKPLESSKIVVIFFCILQN